MADDSIPDSRQFSQHSPPIYNQQMAETLMPGAPLEHGAMVLVTLNSPREKFWGAVLAMTVAGVCVRGISLESFDDFAHQIKTGESADPAVVFFPMHRVERIELDARYGDVPSLSERFFGKSGHNAIEVFYREVGG
jgi:hypothetical protein